MYICICEKMLFNNNKRTKKRASKEFYPITQSIQYHFSHSSIRLTFVTVKLSENFLFEFQFIWCNWISLIHHNTLFGFIFLFFFSQYMSSTYDKLNDLMFDQSFEMNRGNEWEGKKNTFVQIQTFVLCFSLLIFFTISNCCYWPVEKIVWSKRKKNECHGGDRKTFLPLAFHHFKQWMKNRMIFRVILIFAIFFSFSLVPIGYIVKRS